MGRDYMLASRSRMVIMWLFTWVLLALAGICGLVIAAPSSGDGKIQLSLIADGKPLTDVEFEVYKSGSEDYVDGPNFQYKSGLKSFEASVPAGTYDILVRPMISGFSERWVKEVAVAKGGVVNRTVDFGRVGLARVKVTVDGKALDKGNITLLKNGTEIAWLEYNPSSKAFESSVQEGTYRLMASTGDDKISEAEIDDFNVPGGGVGERSVELNSTKVLYIEVTSGDKPYSQVQVFVEKDGQQVTGATFDDETKCFKTVLVDGTYDVAVKPYEQGFPQTTLSGVKPGTTIRVSLPETVGVQLAILGTHGVSYPSADVSLDSDGVSIPLFWDKKKGFYSGKAPQGVYDIDVQPNGYYAPQTVKGIEVSSNSPKLSVELFRAQPASSVDLSHVMSRSDLVDMAKEYKDSYYYQLPLLTKGNLDKQFAEVAKAKGRDKEALVNAATTSASFLAAKAQGREIAVTLAAGSVLESPDNPLAVNNFGALLRQMSLTEESVKVLNYGRIIASESPMILTNLANSLLELGDDEAAETFYLSALRTTPDFAQAHHGLGSIYLARGDMQGALQHFFAAVSGFATRKGQSAIKQAVDTGVKIADDMVKDMGGTSGTDGGSNSSATSFGDELKIPDLPSWPTLEAFIANENDVAKWAGDIMDNGLSKPLKMAMDLLSNKSNPSAGIAKAYDGPYAGQVFQIECYGYWLQDRVTQAMDDYLESFDPAQKAWGDDVADIGETQAAKMEAAAEPMKHVQGLEAIPVGRQAFSKIDDADQVAYKERMAAAAKLYNTWQPLVADAYRRVSDAVAEYWAYTDSAAGRIYDPDVTGYVDQIRQMAVYSSFVPLATELSGRNLFWKLAAIGPLLRPPGEKQPDLPPSQPMEAVQVPPTPKNDCPFKNGVAAQGTIGIVSAKIDCETVELKVGEGVEASVTYNFKHKYVSSLYAGVGVSAGAGGVKLGASAGMRVNFGSDGQVLGVSGETGTSAQAGVGPLSVTAESGGGLVVGLGQ